MKAMGISMCGGRVSRSVKLSIGLFSRIFAYSDFSDMTFTTYTLIIPDGPLPDILLNVAA